MIESGLVAFRPVSEGSVFVVTARGQLCNVFGSGSRRSARIARRESRRRCPP